MRRITKPKRSQQPSNEGLFTFLVLIVHGWQVVSQDHLQMQSSEPLAQEIKSYPDQLPRTSIQKKSATQEHDCALAADHTASNMTPSKIGSSKFVTDQFQAVQALLTDFFSHYPEVCITCWLCATSIHFRTLQVPEGSQERSMICLGVCHVCMTSSMC
jgi:hypothetical protein